MSLLHWGANRAFAVLAIVLGLALLTETYASDVAKRGAATDEEAAGFAGDVKPFLQRYCVQCHGKKAAKADRRFHQLSAEIPDDNALVDLQDILDQLNLGAMPPDEAKQPSASERKASVAWLTSRIAREQQQSRGLTRETSLRRLNAREYRATISDLLSMNMSMFDPTTSFPRDQTVEHLDNIGGTLVMSGDLLARHLDAADQVVSRIMRLKTKPEVQQWKFSDNLRQQPEIDQVHRKTSLFKWLTLYDVPGADKPEGAYAPILPFREGVPHDGYYELRIHAEALNRENPYDPEFLGRDPAEPLRLGIVAGHQDAGPLHKTQPIEPLLAEIDLSDSKRWYTVRVWLDRGYTPRFTFQNGLMDVRSLWGRLVKRYADQFPKRKRGGIVEVRYNAIKYGKLPQIRIHDVEIRGPIYEQWPPASHLALLGEQWEDVVKDDQRLTDELMRSALLRFMSRAYRRPVSERDLAPVMGVIQNSLKVGDSVRDSRLEAFADGIKMTLCSPHFLYLQEPVAPPAASGQGNQVRAAPRRLSDHALASRLSYFLWGTMPDDQMRELVEAGKLRDQASLRKQARWMLEDSQSDAFVRAFLDSWLTLRDLGSSPPDRRDFGDYYRFNLRAAMKQESFLFARDLIDQDASVFRFLDADYTFVNKRLASHYRIPWKEQWDRQRRVPGAIGFLSDHEFRRVELPGRRRGGLLGQASVLTVSANGIDTSPVVRGVWMLENVLGTPPSPPPPDVEPLDPDIRGAKTIRDQLNKHRNNPACYDCHRKIDPLGFALENFDPIGRWRDNYQGKRPVDASGMLPDGRKFSNVGELKTLLASQRSVFARAITRKLLEFGTGRKMTPLDRPAIDKIVRELDENDGFATLIENVVLSEPFLSP